MKSSVVCLVLLAYLNLGNNEVNSLKILGIFPYQGKSHFFVFKPYLQELAKRGHEVTVISHFPDKEPVDRYKDVSLAGSVSIVEDVEDEKSNDSSYLSIFQVTLFLTSTGADNCRVMLGNENVQKLWKSKKKFDLVVTEQFNTDCSLGLAYALGAPVLGTTSHIFMPWHEDRFGVPSNPSFTNFHFLEGGTKPTLYQKVERIIARCYLKLLFKFLTQRQDQNTLAQYFNDIPPLEELGREIKFVLLYHNFVLTGSKLFPANVIEVGGYHVKTPKPLTGELAKFIEEAEHGVIYVSFGSVMKASTLPKNKLDAIIGAFAKLPQRVVWKWEAKTLPGNPKNIYIARWLPQNDILGHSNVVAFYSHAGMLGTTEAIHHGVPVVAMPIAGDQPANAASIEESGLGIQVQLRSLSKESLLEAFQKVLTPKFREQVKKLSSMWHDRPLPPMETAIFWTEFAARHGNATFRTPAADVPLYQFLGLDVIAVASGALFILYFLLRLIGCRCCKALKTGPKVAKKDKRKPKKE